MRYTKSSEPRGSKSSHSLATSSMTWSQAQTRKSKSKQGNASTQNSLYSQRTMSMVKMPHPYSATWEVKAAYSIRARARRDKCRGTLPSSSWIDKQRKLHTSTLEFLRKTSSKRSRRLPTVVNLPSDISDDIWEKTYSKRLIWINCANIPMMIRL